MPDTDLVDMVTSLNNIISSQNKIINIGATVQEAAETRVGGNNYEYCLL